MLSHSFPFLCLSLCLCLSLSPPLSWLSVVVRCCFLCDAEVQIRKFQKQKIAENCIYRRFPCEYWQFLASHPFMGLQLSCFGNWVVEKTGGGEVSRRKIVFVKQFFCRKRFTTWIIITLLPVAWWQRPCEKGGWGEKREDARSPVSSRCVYQHCNNGITVISLFIYSFNFFFFEREKNGC